MQGSCGFFLFYTNDKIKLRKAMNKNKIKELNFNFEFNGTTIFES